VSGRKARWVGLGLVATAGAGVLGLSAMMNPSSAYADDPLPDIGLVIGGALGNIVDRIYRGAVVDFLDFHWGAWHWFAFNLADAAITLGVIFIALDGMLGERRRAGLRRPRGRAGSSQPEQCAARRKK